MTLKVKVIKNSQSMSYDEEYENILYPVSTDWEEVSEKEYSKLMDAIRYANLQSKDGVYHLISYKNSEEGRSEVFKLASEFKAVQKKREEEQKRREEEAKKKREASALARKKKQLEKLKKELEEL